MRKQTLDKYGDKIEDVKKEVTFFNNFLMDGKRPSLPELKLPPLPGPGQGEESPLASCLMTNACGDWKLTGSDLHSLFSHPGHLKSCLNALGL